MRYTVSMQINTDMSAPVYWKKAPRGVTGTLWTPNPTDATPLTLEEATAIITRKPYCKIEPVKAAS